MKTILITGGHGDIASAIIDVLKDKNKYSVFSPSHTEMDVTDIKAVHSYISKIGKIDILINNAGINVDTNILTSNIEIATRNVI